jgi:hypothetical protein
MPLNKFCTDSRGVYQVRPLFQNAKLKEILAQKDCCCARRTMQSQRARLTRFRISHFCGPNVRIADNIEHLHFHTYILRQFPMSDFIRYMSFDTFFRH